MVPDSGIIPALHDLYSSEVPMDENTRHPEALQCRFPGSGVRLPQPFDRLAVLQRGLGVTGDSPAGALLLFAWTGLLLDDTPVAEGELVLSPDGLQTCRIEGETPVQGAGFVCTLNGSFDALRTQSLPRVLSPGIDLRLLAGTGFSRASDVLADKSCALASLKLARMMRFEFQPEYPARVVAVVSGSVQLEGRTLEADSIVAVTGAKTVYIDALAPSVLVLLAGQA
jgi:hypothetical protein